MLRCAVDPAGTKTRASIYSPFPATREVAPGSAFLARGLRDSADSNASLGCFTAQLPGKRRSMLFDCAPNEDARPGFNPSCSVLSYRPDPEEVVMRGFDFSPPRCCGVGGAELTICTERSHNLPPSARVQTERD
jgi:hypothetical protein